MKVNNKKGFVFSGIIYSILITFLALIFLILSLLSARKFTIDKMKNDTIKDLNNVVPIIPDPNKPPQNPDEGTYDDGSGAEKPDFLSNMIPIKYIDPTPTKEGHWVYADPNEEWYNYGKKQWANAVVMAEGTKIKIGADMDEKQVKLWYVWIPRYRYKIFNTGLNKISPQEINIQFEDVNSESAQVTCEDNPNLGTSGTTEDCKNVTTDNWYTHPAFTFGNNKLRGIWVGKFEITGTESMITVTPNATPLIGLPLSQYFELNLKVTEQYNLNANTHLIKNTEWGAVTYLSHSKYGITQNISVNKVISTGGGNYKNNVSQSTTGNVYGIYDMSGGAFEIVMGNMVDSSGNFNPTQSGFSINLDPKFYDKYANVGNSFGGDFGGSYGTATKSRLGDAIMETSGWYGNGGKFLRNGSPWLTRGGSSKLANFSGLFNYGFSTGTKKDNSETTTRSVALTE